jgi:hypothetical protein
MKQADYRGGGLRVSNDEGRGRIERKVNLRLEEVRKRDESGQRESRA